MHKSENWWLQEEGGLGGGKMSERDWEVQASSYGISHGAKQYSIGNIVSGQVMVRHGDRQ